MDKKHILQVLKMSSRGFEVPPFVDVFSGAQSHYTVSFRPNTPQQVKLSPEPHQLVYGYHATSFGAALIAMADDEICALYFVDSPSGLYIDELQEQWPESNINLDTGKTGEEAAKVFTSTSESSCSLSVRVKGTPLQIKVWRALAHIPQGALVSYSDVAAAIGQPKAVRAVANAIARNPVSYLVPCHRVIQKTGGFHHYRWGADRKKALITWEQAQ